MAVNAVVAGGGHVISDIYRLRARSITADSIGGDGFGILRGRFDIDLD